MPVHFLRSPHSFLNIILRFYTAPSFPKDSDPSKTVCNSHPNKGPRTGERGGSGRSGEPALAPRRAVTGSSPASRLFSLLFYTRGMASCPRSRGTQEEAGCPLVAWDSSPGLVPWDTGAAPMAGHSQGELPVLQLCGWTADGTDRVQSASLSGSAAVTGLTVLWSLQSPRQSKDRIILSETPLW